jgi:hypothetical protein
VKSWDRRALEGLPLRLLIMSLLISLTVPVVMGSVESYDRSTVRSAMVSEAGRFVGMVEEVMSSGEGNRRVVSVSLPQNVDRFHYAIEIGGAMGATSSLTVRCTCDGVPFTTLAPESPPARMVPSDGRVLRLEGGEHIVTVECVRMEERMVAVVEVVE